MRYTTSPEKLVIGGCTYNSSSRNATTFFILGSVIAYSHQIHAVIINGLRKMSDAMDQRTAKEHDIGFSAPLEQAILDRFKKNWVGVLGTVRRKNKAGRIWKDVQTVGGETVSVISFWAGAKSIAPTDLELLRETFDLNSRVFVEYIDRKKTVILSVMNI